MGAGIKLLQEVHLELPKMQWQCSRPGAPEMVHYTGRSPKWVIQLVCLGEQRMGTAVSGSTVLKLTDELALEAEQVAKQFVPRPEWA